MPPKSREFQRLVREVLAPVLADLGFTRPRTVGLGGWVREAGDGWLLIWTQLNRRNAGDDPEGYTFTVELQLGDRPVAGFGGPRARLYELLTDDERVAHLAIHNEVIRRTRPNPAALEVAGDRAAYVARFRPRSAPFGRSEDVWFRYLDERDVRRWLAFVGSVLPGAIDRFLASASA